MIIFQPEDDRDRTGEEPTSKCYDVGNVSEPFVPKLYRCVDAYKTKDTKNRTFKVAMDETLEVIIKDQAGMCTLQSKLLSFPFLILIPLQQSFPCPPCINGPGFFFFGLLWDTQELQFLKMVAKCGRFLMLSKSDFRIKCSLAALIYPTHCLVIWRRDN